jgi:hypothetical protein
MRCGRLHLRRISMPLNRIVSAAVALGLTAGTLGLATPTFAATMHKPMHHVLVCKKGYEKIKVKSHGKWVWACHRVHHVKHPMLPMKPKH